MKCPSCGFSDEPMRCAKCGAVLEVKQDVYDVNIDGTLSHVRCPNQQPALPENPL